MLLTILGILLCLGLSIGVALLAITIYCGGLIADYT